MPDLLDAGDPSSASVDDFLSTREQELYEELSAAYDTFEKLDISVTLSNESSMWRVSSALQKSIRRGRPDLAAKYATAMVNGGKSDYLWSRLPVIALEDVAFGSITVCAMVLAICRWKHVRAKFDEVKLAQLIAMKLAVVTKSRAFCDVLCLQLMEQKNYGVVENSLDLDNWLPSFLLPTDVMADFGKMAYVANRLMGDRRYENEMANASGVASGPPPLQTKQALRSEFSAFMISLLPRDWAYCLLAGAKKNVHGLHVSACLWRGYQLDPPTTVVTVEMQPPVMLAGIPDVAFDQHTAEGKRALAYIAKSYAPFAQFFAENPTLSPVAVLGMLLFHVESSLLIWETWNPVIASLRERCEAKECQQVGLTVMRGNQMKEEMKTPAFQAAMLYARKRVLGLV